MTNTSSRGYRAGRAIGNGIATGAAAVPGHVWRWIFGLWVTGWAITWAFIAAAPTSLGWRFVWTGAALVSALIAFRAIGGAAAASRGGHAKLWSLFMAWGEDARSSRFRAFVTVLPIATLLIGVTAITSHRWGGSARVILAAATVLVALRGTKAGHIVSDAQQISWSTTEAFRARVAAVLGVPVEKVEYTVNADSSAIIIFPVPQQVINHLSDLDARLALHLPDFEVREATAEQIVFTPASEATTARRDVATASSGLVLYIADEDVVLAPGTSPASAPAVSAYLSSVGLDLVEWLPYEGRARAIALDPTTRALRTRYADVLRVQPWDLELAVTTADGRIDTVALLRAPTPNSDADRRNAVWRALVAVTPGGSDGWKIAEDYAGHVTLTYGEAASLPDRAARAALLPDVVTSSDWDSIPLGVGGAGQAVGLDLNLGPHSLVVGPTGSGKTVELLQHIVSALTRGHQIAVIDPTKAGLDFIKIKPWVTVWADTLPAAQTAIERIYAEVQRRKAVLQREECVKWSELPAAVRDAENIRPMTVIIDEFGSLVLQDESAKSLPRDHPQRVAIDAENLSRAVILSLTARIAREARYAGIHLAIALQRPDAGIISGEMRANLTSAVQLAAPGKPLSLDALRMVFPGDAAGEAYTTLRALDDGHSRGLAVTAAEGGSMTAFRVGYATAAENPTLLFERGVPTVETPWDLSSPAAAPSESLPAPDFWS